MTAEIIAVGTELLLGQIANTNARFLSQKLSELGIDSYFQTVVGDNTSRLKEALSIASNRADVIITTGGLGPTEDDLTKETIADFCGLKCLLHQESLNRMTERFERQNVIPTENNKKQAYLPENSMVLKNNNGTAPGCIIEHHDKIFIMLPGPPFEMKPMFTDYAFSYLAEKSNSILFSKTLRIFGIGESALEDKMKDILKNQSNPTIAMYAKQGEVTIRLTAKSETEENAKLMLTPLENQIRELLGDMIYGEGELNSLENTVIELLTRNNLKLATAESCTGGLVARMLTSISGASACFECGVITYSNEQKQNLIHVSGETLKNHGAVSYQTALEMSAGVKKLANSDIGISITGIAGPGGGSEDKPVGLVYISLCTENKHIYRELHLAGDRNTIQTRTAMYSLDMVRKYLLENY